jgi:hypothetical protein
MQEQRSSSPEEIDGAIMGLLLDDRFDLWAIAEIEREIGDPVATGDSLRRLRGAGLVHEIGSGGFVTASRAARVADDLS